MSQDYSKKFEAIRELPLVPTQTHICVRILPQLEKVSAGGIVTDTNPDKADLNAALVIAAGKDCKLVRPGQLVSISPVATSYSVWHKGEKLGVMKEEQVFGVYDDPEKVFVGSDWKDFGREEAMKRANDTGYVM